MKKRKPGILAFSLVEVTLALGVVAFCIVTILGLLAVGVNTTHVSTVQTSAANILTSVASDLEADPNLTPSYGTSYAKGSIVPITKAAVVATRFTSASPAVYASTPLYGIQLPAGGAGATSAAKIYIGENGQTNSSAANALYQLNVWMTANNTATAPIHQETTARLLITWPATAPYTSAQGYVETVVAINRN